MANALRDGGFSRTACLPPRRRLLATATATVTFGMTAALLGSCSSGKQASDLDNATNTLRERLAATEKPLGQQAQPAFQAVADAMAAARNAGMSSQAMLGEVLASKVRLWNRPGGMDTYLANNQALTGKTVMVPAPVRGSSAPGGKNAADRPAAGPPNPPRPKTFLVNGVLNNGGADLAHATATVGGAANTQVTGVYNFSFKDPIDNVELGQQSATSPGVLENKPDDLKTLINSIAGPYSLPGTSVKIVASGYALEQSLPQLIDKWASPDAARANSAYAPLKAAVTDALNSNTPVILIGHSEGGFVVRQVKTDADAEWSQAHPGSPSPIGVLYLAPPFQDETGASLTKPGSGYVLLNGDFIRGANLLRIPATADPAPPQPTQNPINIHLLDTYLQKGSRSAQQFVDNYTTISTYVCDSIARGGGGGKQAPGNAGPCGQQPSGIPTAGGTTAPPPSGGTGESPTEQPSTGGTTEQPPTGQTPPGTEQPSTEQTPPGTEQPSTGQPPGSPQTSMPQTPGHSGCCGQPQGAQLGPATDEDRRRTQKTG